MSTPSPSDPPEPTPSHHSPSAHSTSSTTSSGTVAPDKHEDTATTSSGTILSQGPPALSRIYHDSASPSEQATNRQAAQTEMVVADHLGTSAADQAQQSSSPSSILHAGRQIDHHPEDDTENQPLTSEGLTPRHIPHNYVTPLPMARPLTPPDSPLQSIWDGPPVWALPRPFLLSLNPLAARQAGRAGQATTRERGPVNQDATVDDHVLRDITQQIINRGNRSRTDTMPILLVDQAGFPTEFLPPRIPRTPRRPLAHGPRHQPLMMDLHDQVIFEPEAPPSLERNLATLGGALHRAPLQVPVRPPSRYETRFPIPPPREIEMLRTETEGLLPQEVVDRPQVGNYGPQTGTIRQRASSDPPEFPSSNLVSRILAQQIPSPVRRPSRPSVIPNGGYPYPSIQLLNQPVHTQTIPDAPQYYPTPMNNPQTMYAPTNNWSSMTQGLGLNSGPPTAALYDAFPAFPANGNSEPAQYIPPNNVPAQGLFADIVQTASNPALLSGSAFDPFRTPFTPQIPFPLGGPSLNNPHQVPGTDQTPLPSAGSAFVEMFPADPDPVYDYVVRGIHPHHPEGAVPNLGNLPTVEQSHLYPFIGNGQQESEHDRVNGTDGTRASGGNHLNLRGGSSIGSMFGMMGDILSLEHTERTEAIQSPPGAKYPVVGRNRAGRRGGDIDAQPTESLTPVNARAKQDLTTPDRSGNGAVLAKQSDNDINEGSTTSSSTGPGSDNAGHDSEDDGAQSPKFASRRKDTSSHAGTHNTPSPTATYPEDSFNPPTPVMNPVTEPPNATAAAPASRSQDPTAPDRSHSRTHGRLSEISVRPKWYKRIFASVKIATRKALKRKPQSPSKVETPISRSVLNTEDQSAAAVRKVNTGTETLRHTSQGQPRVSSPYASPSTPPNSSQQGRKTAQPPAAIGRTTPTRRFDAKSESPPSPKSKSKQRSDQAYPPHEEIAQGRSIAPATCMNESPGYHLDPGTKESSGTSLTQLRQAIEQGPKELAISPMIDPGPFSLPEPVSTSSARSAPRGDTVAPTPDTQTESVKRVKFSQPLAKQEATGCWPLKRSFFASHSTKKRVAIRDPNHSPAAQYFDLSMLLDGLCPCLGVKANWDDNGKRREQRTGSSIRVRRFGNDDPRQSGSSGISGEETNIGTSTASSSRIDETTLVTTGESKLHTTHAVPSSRPSSSVTPSPSDLNNPVSASSRYLNTTAGISTTETASKSPRIPPPSFESPLASTQAIDKGESGASINASAVSERQLTPPSASGSGSFDPSPAQSGVSGKTFGKDAETPGTYSNPPVSGENIIPPVPPLPDAGRSDEELPVSRLRGGSARDPDLVARLRRGQESKPFTVNIGFQQGSSYSPPTGQTGMHVRRKSRSAVELRSSTTQRTADDGVEAATRGEEQSLRTSTRHETAPSPLRIRPSLYMDHRPPSPVRSSEPPRSPSPTGSALYSGSTSPPPLLTSSQLTNPPFIPEAFAFDLASYQIHGMPPSDSLSHISEERSSTDTHRRASDASASPLSQIITHMSSLGQAAEETDNVQVGQLQPITSLQPLGQVIEGYGAMLKPISGNTFGQASPLLGLESSRVPSGLGTRFSGYTFGQGSPASTSQAFTPEIGTHPTLQEILNEDEDNPPSPISKDSHHVANVEEQAQEILLSDQPRPSGELDTRPLSEYIPPARPDAIQASRPGAATATATTTPTANTSVSALSGITNYIPPDGTEEGFTNVDRFSEARRIGTSIHTGTGTTTPSRVEVEQQEAGPQESGFEGQSHGQSDAQNSIAPRQQDTEVASSPEQGGRLGLGVADPRNGASDRTISPFGNQPVHEHLPKPFEPRKRFLGRVWDRVKRPFRK
ncbi:uncharacterized protein I303_100063 [Kwoniella dejecticola CBS 10117]|uniref:PI-PLC Y-box domain-containing protein n=1 Tax=Kwoniella dejecticola CBS 10117 TaxID=1296121 RepID=A0A1A6ADV7_9TREE|nr:uncharacterized protein I303_00063 [Kwoniella dejecticola CBS 10117]OBR88252.1 hypothetical protein I303_00063 [Kwoniella dejecticola CBS 10117]